jgi:hypothetical protein
LAKQSSISREPGAAETIGFDKCVRKCVSDAPLKAGCAPFAEAREPCSVTWNAGSFLGLQLNGSVPGVTYDHLSVLGTVSMNASSSLNANLGFTPAQGQVFVIVNNDGTEPVSGTFSGLPQDAVFNLGPYPFKISYIGKTCNDVTITSLSGDPFNHAPVAVDDA